MPAAERHATVNGIRMHYVERGEGPSVVLLHGFPETHRSWYLTAPRLAEAGYRVVTPDLRGYGKTSRPRHGYDLDTLARDVAELAQSLDCGPVRLVGHDWGGGVAWHVAAHHPSCVEQLIVLDCPHPALMAKALLQNPRQRRRSWYMFFFQLPALPERWLTKNAGANLARMFRQADPGPAQIVDAERRALLEPGAASAALAYYRSSIRSGALDLLRGGKRYPIIEAPTTVVWGTEDSCLGLELIDGTEKLVRELEVHHVAGAGHFVHQERPEEVNRLLLQVLEQPRPASSP